MSDRAPSVKKQISLLLSDIRSVHNVGSIFRTAEAAGVSNIYLCGTTPTPLDRFGRERKDLAKVALGAEKMVRWEYAESAVDVVMRLKKEGLLIISLEQSESSVGYAQVKLLRQTLLILGSEVEGVPKNLLELSDVVYEIPMLGKKESLNVSVAAGIALFKLIERRKID
jgi:tRNA G18 (ribose-2'-O)-methylase SpoU